MIDRFLNLFSKDSDVPVGSTWYFQDSKEDPFGKEENAPLTTVIDCKNG